MDETARAHHSGDALQGDALAKYLFLVTSAEYLGLTEDSHRLAEVKPDSLNAYFGSTGCSASVFTGPPV